MSPVAIIESSHYSSGLCQQSKTGSHHETATRQLDSTIVDNSLSTLAVTHYYSDSITGSTVFADGFVDGLHRKALSDFVKLAIQYCAQS